MSKNHLVIGLGGTGGKTLRAFRKTLFQEFRSLNNEDVNIEYLYLDSSNEMMSPDDPTWRIFGKSVQLSTSSQLLITGANLRNILDNVDNFPGIKPWIGSKEDWYDILGGILGETLGGQKRRLGRFLFACKASQFVSQLTNQVRELQAKGEVPVTFHVCTGLAGGTGSGSLIDVLAQIRDNYPDSKNYRIIVYALLPERNPNPNWDTGNYHANGYAALMELNALSIGSLKPWDVTGKKGRMELQDPFNGCYIFCNANEKGLIIDVNTDVPNLLASFLYQKIVAVRTVQWDSLRRMENAENGDSTPESISETKTPQRGKRFLTFGIKRLAIPEEEIREYITYCFSKESVLQLLYNNWSDAMSYAEEPKNQSFKEYVIQRDVQQRWMISDDHIRLSLGIIDDEIKNTRWKPINNTWQDIMPQFKSFVRESYSSNPRVWLDELAKLLQKFYAQDYRELGVERFYSTKEGDRKDHIRQIRNKIESDLMTDWKNGVQSMSDIRRLLDALIASLQDRLAGIDDKIAQSVQNDQSAGQRSAAIVREWAGIGILSSLMGKRDKLMDTQGDCLMEQYVYRTNITAWRFAKGLMQGLVDDITDLQNDVSVCTAVISSVRDEFDKAIASRCNDGSGDIRQQFVKFYDSEVVKNFTKSLIRDKDGQFKQTQAMRDALFSQINDRPTFATFSQRLIKEKLMSAMESVCEENAVIAHDIKVNESQDKTRLIGASIVEKLHNKYGGNLEAAQGFVRDLVNSAGNYCNFKQDEVSKSGEGIPAGVPTKISNFTVMIPASEALADFAEELHKDFKASTTMPIDFIPSKDIPCQVKPNEITLISITNLFPLRYLDETNFLREKFNTRISSSDATRRKLELFGEGDGSVLPPLFVPTSLEVSETAVPFIILGRAMNIVQEVTDRSSGMNKLCLVTKDAEGFDNPPVEMGTTLIDSLGTLNSASCRTLTTAVQNGLANEFAGADKKDALQKSIVVIIEEIKAARGGDVTDPIYLRFLDAGKRAVKITRGVN